MAGSFYPGGGYPGLYVLRRDTTVVGTRITIIGSRGTYNLVASDDGETYSMTCRRETVLNLVANDADPFALVGSVNTTFGFLASQQHGND